jgi:hypothetical protein
VKGTQYNVIFTSITFAPPEGIEYESLTANLLTLSKAALGVLKAAFLLMELKKWIKQCGRSSKVERQVVALVTSERYRPVTPDREGKVT